MADKILISDRLIEATLNMLDWPDVLAVIDWFGEETE